MEEPIKFYTTGEDYDCLSNVVETPFEMDLFGTNYKVLCSEQVFQALKNLFSPQAQDIIKSNQTPGGWLQDHAKAITVHPFWHQTYLDWSCKEQFMYEILLAKFTQNIWHLKWLLQTGDLKIIENTFKASYNDDFWGNGKSGNGRNALGKILMRIRTELQQELFYNKNIQIRFGLSDATAKIFPPEQFKFHQTGSQFKTGYYITQQNLDAVPACHKAAEGLNILKQNQFNHTLSKNPNIPLSQMYPPSVKDKILEMLKGKVAHLKDLEVVKDPNISNEYVVKFVFEEAGTGENGHVTDFIHGPAKGKTPFIIDNTDPGKVILGPQRFPLAFNRLKLGSESMGKKIFEELVNHQFPGKNYKIGFLSYYFNIK